MTKSALSLAKTALNIAQKAMPAYSHRNSPKTYTQHQHFSILVVRQFFGLDYRATAQLLADWSDLRECLGLTDVPHYTCIQKAEKRLLKKGASHSFSTAALKRPFRSN
jgi:hypothetical protein